MKTKTRRTTTKTSPPVVSDERWTPDPHEAAFLVARRVAATSPVVQLTAGALEIADGDVTIGLDATEQALRHAYAANGVPHAQAAGDRALEHLDFELALRQESGYLFGLAVGLALGRGAR